MKIQEKHKYHGSALAQVVEHEAFKALNRADSNYGHYLVNTDRRLIVKYRTCERGPWVFNFTAPETVLLRTDIERGGHTFVCLVCGNETVCILDEDQASSVLDLGSVEQQWIKVSCPEGCSMRVSGSSGDLSSTIPHKAFPRRVFE